MTDKEKTIDAWVGQVEDKVRSIVKTKWDRNYLARTEGLMLDWTREKGFAQMDIDNRQFDHLFNKYSHQLPENIIEGLAENVIGFATPRYCNQPYREWMRYLRCEHDETVDGFRAEFFEVFVDEFSDLDIQLEFELTLNTKKGGDYVAMVYFPLLDLCQGIHEVDDIDEEGWSERIRNATGLDVSNCNLYQIHEE